MFDRYEMRDHGRDQGTHPLKCCEYRWIILFAALLLKVSPALSLSSLSASSEVRYVNGRRCLFTAASNCDEGGRQSKPPIVVLGGMAQTVSSWEHHMPALAQERAVLVYECNGQGLPAPDIDHADYTNVTLPNQAKTLAQTLDQLDDILGEPVDVVGFSFGGRVAMAFSCLYPNRVRKLFLTGVGMDRSDYGHLAVRSWKDCLKTAVSDNGDSSAPLMRPFAWSVLLATYSSAFLQDKGDSGVERFVRHICTTNHPQGLLALLEQAEINDKNDNWHAVSMANRIRSTAPAIRGRVCVGEFDQMAPVPMAEQLCQYLGWTDELSIIPNCAHAVSLEAPLKWKKEVLKFLDEDE